MIWGCGGKEERDEERVKEMTFKRFLKFKQKQNRKEGELVMPDGLLRRKTVLHIRLLFLVDDERTKD